MTIAIVIDDGRSSPRADCLSVPNGTKASDALNTRAERLHMPPPRFDVSGLLCSIDGYPESGCGEGAGSDAYTYWSYWWKDGNGWRYAPAGPASRRLTADGTVDGWHFITGRNTGQGNAPRIGPDSVSFNAAPPVTQPPPTATNPMTPGPAPATHPPASFTPGTPPNNVAGGAAPGAPTPTTAPGSNVTTTVVGRLTDPAAGPDAAITPTTAAEGTTGRTDDGIEVAGESVSRVQPIASVDDGSSAPNLIGAAVVILAIGGGGASVLLRRRKSR